MPLFSDINTLFFHIPKTGGTGIINQLSYLFPNPLFNTTQSISDEKKLVLWHATPNQLYKYNLIRNFENLNTVCVVRNPFDKIVSSYTWLYHAYCKDFEEYIDIVKVLVEKNLEDEEIVEHEIWPQCGIGLISNHFIPQTHYVFQADWFDMKYVLRFENLAKDLMRFKALTGVPVQSILVNTSNRNPYKEYYNQKTKDIVEQLYKEDLNILEYKF